MAVVYQHTREDKKCVFYIGYASEEKKDYRPYTKFNRNKYWHNIVDVSEYRVEILIDDLSDRDAFAWEEYLIGLHGRANSNSGHLVNITSGGQGFKGPKHTEGSRKLLSEHKKKLFQDRSKHPMYGKKGPDNPNYGRVVTNDTIAKISKANSGVNNGMYGRKGELCPNSKKVTDGITIWGSAKLAAEHFGVERRSISKMIKGIRPNKYNLSYYEPNK